MFRVFLLLTFVTMAFAKNFLEFASEQTPKESNTTREHVQKRVKIPTH